MPLSLAELPKAAMSLPIGFIKQEDNYLPAAILNLQPGKNLLVATNGNWLGPYIPAAFRAFPFVLATTENGQKVLCIDEDSGLVNDEAEGEPFFDEEGNPSKAIQDVLAFMTQQDKSRQATASSCAMLAKHELIQPWPINLQTDSGMQEIAGIFRIDEEKLNRIPAEALSEVRDSGGLTIAYCQLLSIQHLSLLGELARAHAKAVNASQNIVKNGELDIEFLKKTDSISFSGF